MRRSFRKWYSAHAWPEVTGRCPVRKSRDFFPQYVSRTFFPYIFPYFFSPVLSPPNFFSRTFFSVLFSTYFSFSYYFPRIFFPFLYFFFLVIFFPVLFSPVLFISRTFSKFATFQIQRFKISVSCFSSTCRYITVHVPCGIAIQTSPVGLHLEGWGVRMRDLKGPKMNLFNPKEDWNVL